MVITIKQKVLFVLSIAVITAVVLVVQNQPKQMSWEERQAQTNKLETKQKELAVQIEKLATPARCQSNADCFIMGLGPKVCEHHRGYMIYSALGGHREVIEQLIGEFNTRASELHLLSLRAPDCGVAPGEPICDKGYCSVVLPGRDPASIQMKRYRAGDSPAR